jgi:hypothetical protein
VWVLRRRYPRLQILTRKLCLPEGLRCFEYRVDFTSRPPRTRRFHPGPRLSCSLHGCGLTTLCAAGLPVAPLFRLRWMGSCFGRGSFASFHLLQPRLLAMRLPPQLQYLSCPQSARIRYMGLDWNSSQRQRCLRACKVCLSPKIPAHRGR